MKNRILLGLAIMGLFNFFGCKSGKKSNSNSELDQEMQDMIAKSVEEFNNRKIYDKLTTDIIENTPDHQLIQTIFDNIDTNFEYGEQYTVEKVQHLTQGQQAIFSIWMLTAEVNNGGFNQFYFNPSGKFAQMAETALKYIGADKYFELVKNANKTYSKIKDELSAYDDGTIESFSESYENNPLNRFDEKFFALDEAESLASIQITFIRKNMVQFIK